MPLLSLRRRLFQKVPLSGAVFSRFFPRRRLFFYLTRFRALLLHSGVQPVWKFCEGFCRRVPTFVILSPALVILSEAKNPSLSSPRARRRLSAGENGSFGLRPQDDKKRGVILSTHPRHSERSEESVSLVSSAAPISSGYRSRQVGFSRSTSSFFRLRRHPFSAFSRLMAS